MAARMMTLFGEELIPETLAGVPKTVAHPSEAAVEAPGTPVQTADSGILAGWAPDKQYYSIGEVAKLFSVRTSHIRFWTTEFGLKVRTTRKGDRLYTPALIRELRVIYHLVKERGFTIPGAKTKLKESSRPATETLDLRQALLQLRNQLVAIRNELL